MLRAFVACLFLALFLMVLRSTCATAAGESIEEPPYLTSQRTKADQGDAQAQFMLCAQTELRFVTAQSQKNERPNIDPVKCWEKYAEQGNPDAAAHLGVLYRTGRFVSNDYASAMKWFRKAAEQHQVLAEHEIGSLYEEGLGVPRDYIEAATWYRKAADQGNADGMLKLGNIYYFGKGVNQDYTEALKWYQQAGAKDNTGAEYMLGFMYHNAQGVAKDDAQAYGWLCLASVPSQPEASVLREQIEKALSPSQIQEAQKWLSQHPFPRAVP